MELGVKFKVPGKPVFMGTCYILGSDDNFDFWKMQMKSPVPSCENFKHFQKGIHFWKYFRDRITRGWFPFHFQKK